jgi:hypothetical protein
MVSSRVVKQSILTVGILLFFATEFSFSKESLELVSPKQKSYQLKSEIGIDSKLTNFNLLMRVDFLRYFGLQADYYRYLKTDYEISGRSLNTFLVTAPVKNTFFDGWYLELFPVSVSNRFSAWEIPIGWGLGWEIGFLKCNFRSFYFTQSENILGEWKFSKTFSENSFSKTSVSLSLELTSFAPTNPTIFFLTGMEFF